MDRKFDPSVEEASGAWDADPLTRRDLIERTLAAGAAVAVPSIFLPGVGRAELIPSVAAKPRLGGRLITAHSGGGTTETLQPHSPTSYVDAARGIQLFDGLTQLAPNNKIRYRLAESLEPSRDAKTWQLKLRPGVTFHDGRPLTAEDVIYSFRYAANPKNADNSINVVEPIDLVRTKKVNTLTVSIALKRSIAYLPLLLCAPWPFAIFPTGTKKTDFGHPVGTGPFIFDSFEPGKSSLFKKNPNYWDSGKPYVDEVQMLSVSDSTARLNSLLNGQVHLMENPDLAQAKAHAKNTAVSVVRSPSVGWVAFFMRMDQAPFNDNRVRQAFRLAVDRPKMIGIADLGYGSLGNDLFGKGFASYDRRDPQMHHDPDRAKSLLKKAGHDKLNVTLFTSPQGPGMVESATVFAQQAKASGINIKLRKIPPADYYNTSLYYLKQPFYQTYWNCCSFETVAPIALFHDSTSNEIAWRRPGWDNRFRKAAGIVDDKKRHSAFDALQHELWEQTGYIIWSYVDNVDLASSKVKGIVASGNAPLGGYDFKSYWLT